MQQHRFFYDGILSKDIKLIISKNIFLHFKTLKIKEGNIIILFNGLGKEYYTNIIKIHKEKIYIKIFNILKKNREIPYKLELVQVLIKYSKINWIIEKSTELGIHSIQFLKTKYCNINYNKKKIKKKFNNWNNIIKSSSEQCGRNILMKLLPIKDFSFWINSKKKKILFSPKSKFSILDWGKNNIPQNISFIIGPEGGFSIEEEKIANHKNIIILSLGSRILRSETAAISAINILKSIWNIL